ncbi:Hypothetical cytosolic protein [Lacticaseibacillus paracasei]|nr:Hypothetical cytosolic protein [Lacticaseibacillus paracasei]
MEASGPVLVFQ